MPVIIDAGAYTDEAQYLASVKKTEFFHLDAPQHFHTTRLTINHRLEPEQEKYCDWLKRIGVGSEIHFDARVFIPEKICVNDRNALIDFVFDRRVLLNPLKFGNELRGCAILCPTNEQVFEVNDLIMVNLTTI